MKKDNSTKTNYVFVLKNCILKEYLKKKIENTGIGVIMHPVYLSNTRKMDSVKIFKVMDYQIWKFLINSK